MLIDIITIFPEFFYGALSSSIIKRARDKEILKLNIVNLRDFTSDKHRSVDDYPYGGGPGMILKPEPLARAIESCSSEKSESQLTIYFSPHGKRLDHDLAKRLAEYSHLIFISGHYEGIDERIKNLYVDEEISIGDYVLTGGELPILVTIDTLIRFIPGALGNQESPLDESFSKGLLEYPQYTRPQVFRNMEVPEVLLSGNHKDIETWKRRESLKQTLLYRPDLLNAAELTDEDKLIIEELKKELELK